jgi:hypothetical protein
MKETTLTTAYAFALGELLNNISSKAKIRWMTSDSEIRTGELRSLVVGPNNFGMMPYGMDVRDAHVWITSNGMERTESVEHLVNMINQGGYETI